VLINLANVTERGTLLDRAAKAFERVRRSHTDGEGETLGKLMSECAAPRAR